MNIARALVDDRGFAVAQITLDRIIVRIAVGAVHFDGHRRGLFAAHGRLPFRQTGSAATRLSFVLQPSRAQPKQPGHLIVGFHIGDLLFDQLMIRDLCAKGLSFICVSDRGIARRAYHSRCARGDGEPSLL